MIALSLTTLLLLASPGTGATDVDSLLAEGRFAEAEAEATRIGDSSALAEVWFRAGLYERVLSIPQADVANATNKLHFLHRQAAAAVRLEHTARAEQALASLTAEIQSGVFESEHERSAWSAEVDAFSTALAGQHDRDEALDSALMRARLAVAGCVLAVGVLLGICRRG